MPKLTKAIRPVFIESIENNEKLLSFGGTGFFVKRNNDFFFITAAHVSGEKDVFILDVDIDEGKTHKAEEIFIQLKYLKSSRKFDLAIFSVDFNPGLWLEIQRDASLNSSFNDVYTLEYSRYSERTDSKYLDLKDPNVNGHIFVNPSIRKGNVVRVASDSIYDFPILELSYPALKGASGSPVIQFDNSKSRIFVVGVILANAETELLPVQTYHFKDEDNTEEMIHYYLPAALAVPIAHLEDLLG